MKNNGVKNKKKPIAFKKNNLNMNMKNEQLPQEIQES